MTEGTWIAELYVLMINPQHVSTPSLENPSSSSHWIPSINFEASTHEVLFLFIGRRKIDVQTEWAIKTLGIAWNYLAVKKKDPTFQTPGQRWNCGRPVWSGYHAKQNRKINILHSGHNPVDVARCSADGQFNWDATQGIVRPIAKLFLCHVEIL